MKLSIIIVNYNVRYFLENCLHSVISACQDIDNELMVIDNASSDESETMMAQIFPSIDYIMLKENIGFSRANNLGISRATGDLVLLLNPDTIVQEDTFKRCIHFFETHPEAGGLGVKMMDGNGNFLPESKRGLPTPKAAFYKIFGLSSLFPKSERFGKYHLGFLDQNLNHEVEILSGAFMMMRKTALDKIGVLDETFFMYGEDIDLSYRILQGGYKNFYFADTSIIHYKGESTKKGSINYVFVFYRAMVIFAKKHFSPGQASVFSGLIDLAIYFRALLSLIRRMLGNWWQFIVDFLIIYSVFALATSGYESYGHKDFSLPFISLLLPVYSVILSLVLYYSGAHDSPFKAVRLIRGWVIALVMLLAIYALLPEGYRFSRAVVLIGSVGSLAAGLIWRIIASKISWLGFIAGENRARRRLVIGNELSLKKLRGLLESNGLPNDFLAGISLTDSNPLGFVARLDQLEEAVIEFDVEELIIDSTPCTYGQVIQLIEKSNGSKPDVKVMNGDWIISPNEIIEPPRFPIGSLLESINMQAVYRNKRAFDFLFSILAFVFSPLLILVIDRKTGFVKNVFQVLLCNKSWIGYDPRGMDRTLPKLKAGVIHPSMHLIWPENHIENSYNVNVRYLNSTSLFSDFQLVVRHIHNLGNQ